MKWIWAFLGLFAGCSQRDPNEPHWMFMPDMAANPVLTGQRDHLEPPPGSVHMNALLYPDSLEEAEELLENPLVPGSHWDEGRHLYEISCSSCHGDKGEGDGPVAAFMMKPPSLVDEDHKKKRDGFFYYKIVFGSAVMPPYGYTLNHHERWAIVQYLRKMQEDQVHGKS